MATFMSMTKASKEAPEITLDRVLYIHYPVQFEKNKSNSNVSVMIISGSKINTMTPAYATKLGFKVWRINVRAEKIESSLLAT